MMRTAVQLFRFGLVGATSNLVLYICYLVITQAGVGPKVAMSIMFGVGIVLTYLLNKKWTFQYQSRIAGTFSRYWAAYALAYALNWTALAVLVDFAGFRHQLVQGLMIILIALFLFVIQKFWVFQKSGSLIQRSDLA